MKKRQKLRIERYSFNPFDNQETKKQKTLFEFVYTKAIDPDYSDDETKKEEDKEEDKEEEKYS